MKMSRSGHEGRKDGPLKCVLEENCINPSIGVNQLTYKLVRVEGDGIYLPASEDEAVEVDCLLAEPQSEKVLNDEIMYLNPESSGNCLAVEDFPCAIDYYDQRTDCGILDSDAAQAGNHQSKYEFPDSTLHGVDEEGNLHLTCNLSAGCPDYLLDTGFAERSSQLDYASGDGSCMENLNSECEAQRLERNNIAAEMSDLPHSINPLPESPPDPSALFLDNMSIRELHDAFRSTFGRDTSVKDKQWLKRRILFGLQNLIDLDNASSLMESGLVSNGNEDSMILIHHKDLSGGVYSSLSNIPDSRTLLDGSAVGKVEYFGEDVPAATLSELGRTGFGHSNLGEKESALITRKRLRKPTRRYIEETSEMKSRNCSERLETPFASSKDNLSRVRADNEYHVRSSGVLPLVYQECPAGSSIQVPCGLRVRRGRPRKNVILMGHDSKGSKENKLRSFIPRRTCSSGLSESELQNDISDDCGTTITNERGGIRRKHHRLWTLTEVMKLIDGVSQYGVGRWTEIKRLLFSASAYRTSVDLKDKWRNLLRASGAQLHTRNKVEPRKKHMSLPMPQSIVRRVRELAIIYPYPRERKSRIPLVATTPITAGTSVNLSGRTVHRRSFT